MLDAILIKNTRSFQVYINSIDYYPNLSILNGRKRQTNLSMLKSAQFFYILVLVLLIGCNKEDNQNNGSELPDSDENIESIPELSVLGTSAIIQTVTELIIKINHVS